MAARDGADMVDDWEAAVKSYTKRLEAKPRDCSTLCNRAFVLVRLERYAEALADAELCVSIEPDFAKGHTRLAQALEPSDRPRALDACARALELDPRDAMAAKMLTRLDDSLVAGLRARRQLAEAAEERRDGVRDLRHKGPEFARKWALLAREDRRKLVMRMLTRAFNEIKAAFLECFEPLEDVQGFPPGFLVTVDALQSELLAVNLVLMSDVLSDEILEDAPAGESPGGDLDDLERGPPMLRFIAQAAGGRECGEKCCGPGMFAMMAQYRFAAFKRHPDAAELSRNLIEAQRSTLCLVICHMLLGGDGLPTLATASQAEGFAPDDEGEDEAAEEPYDEDAAERAFEESLREDADDDDDGDGDDEAAARALEADSEIPPAPRRGDDDEYTDDEQTFEAESDDERAGSPPRRVLGENRKTRRPGDEDLKWVTH